MAFTYTPGLGHAGSYIVSGYPSVTTGSLGSVLDRIDYDYVTKEITILNTHGSSDLYVLFAHDALDVNKFKIASGEQHTFDVKTKNIYFSGSSGTTYSVCASLTSIPNARISEHSGVGINAVPNIS
jgi:hypothetical protein